MMAWISEPVGAQASFDCNPCTTVVAYGNGVWVIDEQDSWEASYRIRQQVESISPSTVNSYQYEIVWNSSNFVFAGDLVESLFQRAQVTYLDAFRATFGLLGPGPVADSLRDLLLEFVSQRYGDALQRTITFDDVDTHVSRYKQWISTEGKRVVVVAHSQGNLFANQSYEFLSPSEKARFGIVAVANPANAVAGRERFLPTETYVTDRKDAVIAAVELVFPSTLDWNWENRPGDTQVQLPAHYFTQYYMQQRSASFIANSVLFLAYELAQQEPPPPPATFIIDTLGTRQFCQHIENPIGPSLGFVTDNFVGLLARGFSDITQSVAIAIDVPPGGSYRLSPVEFAAFNDGGFDTPDGDSSNEVAVFLRADNGGVPSTTQTLAVIYYGRLPDYHDVTDLSDFDCGQTITSLLTPAPVIIPGGTRVWLEMIPLYPETSAHWAFDLGSTPTGLAAYSRDYGPYVSAPNSRMSAFRIVLVPQ